jgi:cytochrome b561
MTPDDRYNAGAIGLHWAIALTTFGLLGLGWTMVLIPLGDPLRVPLFAWHKSLGLTVLVLTLMRIGWRLTHHAPALPDAMPVWQKAASKLGHILVYSLLLGLPLSGWALVSTNSRNIPTIFFGLFEVPHLPVLSTLPDKAPAHVAAETMHSMAGWVLVALLAIHIAAALRHHFILRDKVLIRMLPRGWPAALR